MAIEIGPGWTIGGGISILPPPSTPNSGWFGGGDGPNSLVSRITYATDTATGSTRGPLSVARKSLGATGNLTYGWFAGGEVPGPTAKSTIDRITYATDTATASVRGSLSAARKYLAGTGNTTDGWFGGGRSGTPSTYYTTVDRITYATDTATATTKGPLSMARAALAATGNDTDGWWAGGYASTPSPGTFRSTVDRVTFATDTATASVRGSLTNANFRMAATGTPSYGWFGAGYAGAVVERITFATDTATASVRGPLSSARTYLAASTDSTTYGWFGGGSFTSTVDRITYATDTVTATARGPLSSARSYLAAASGLQ